MKMSDVPNKVKHKRRVPANDTKETYIENISNNNHYDSLDSENSSDDNDNKRTSTHYKKVKQNITQQESRKSSRKISRHRRISAPDNYNPTMIRNIENTEMIEEYEVTEKIPMEIIYSNKSKYKLNESEAQKDYCKYSQKYDIVKNCKYSNENNTNQTIENSDIIENNMQVKKSKHRRVVSANYNCSGAFTKRLNSNKELQVIDEVDHHRESKSNDKNCNYKNYSSNQNPIHPSDVKESKQIKNIRMKRSS